ncbi:unnamed protein product [Camellia sinensis]
MLDHMGALHDQMGVHSSPCISLSTCHDGFFNHQALLAVHPCSLVNDYSLVCIMIDT